MRRAEQEWLAQEEGTNREKLVLLQSIGSRLFGLLDKKQQDQQIGTGRLADESAY